MNPVVRAALTLIVGATLVVPVGTASSSPPKLLPIPRSWIPLAAQYNGDSPILGYHTVRCYLKNTKVIRCDRQPTYQGGTPTTPTPLAEMTRVDYCKAMWYELVNGTRHPGGDPVFAHGCTPPGYLRVPSWVLDELEQVYTDAYCDYDGRAVYCRLKTEEPLGVGTTYCRFCLEIRVERPARCSLKVSTWASLGANGFVYREPYSGKVRPIRFRALC